MIRVLIVDDHAVVRRGLKQILSETEDVVAAGEAGSVQEALDLTAEQRFDVILLDIAMPGRNGLELLAQLRETAPQTRVLVLSMHPEDQYGLRVLRAGASGYLTKESAPEELIAAIRKVASGGRYISPALLERVVASLEKPSDASPHERLSNREYEVLRMIASGKTVKKIAEEMALSEKTISTYRTRILEKMAMTTNAELTLYAVSNGLIQ